MLTVAPYLALAIPKDFQNLSDIINLTYSGYTGKKGWTTDTHLVTGQKMTPKLLEKALNNHTIIIKASYDKDEIDGCIFVDKKQDVALISGLTVVPEMQKLNIGTTLLHAAEYFADDIWNICKTEMTVLKQRPELIKWYKQRGYYDSGIRIPFPNTSDLGIPRIPGLEFVVLIKNL